MGVAEVIGVVWSGTWLSLERLRLSRVVTMGEVDLERSLDGEWSCLELVAVGAVKGLCAGAESYDDGAGSRNTQSLIRALSCWPGPVSLSAGDRELAELRLRYDKDESPKQSGRLSSAR